VVDWESVAEEVDDLGKKLRWSVDGHLETLVEHLLELARTESSENWQRQTMGRNCRTRAL
jgi:hypothetical protein